jgi:serine/threonine protein kinase/tetratricopeptide (TPR) repeat protein
MGGSLEEALLDVMARLEAGETCGPAWIRKHYPDHAKELQRAIEIEERIQTLRAPFEQLGPFRIRRLLGRGGMAAVYLAEATRELDRVPKGELVAVKVIHSHLLAEERFVERFQREATLGQSVRHPNVVQTLHVSRATEKGQNWLYLAMEYVEGHTLHQLLDELGRLPEDLCRHIGVQLSRGLEAIHRAGAIHRDLKPENVIITRGDVAKIMDLGLARTRDSVVRLSQTGEFIGSVRYAPPERLAEHREPVDPRSDLYSLGALLYELATGVPAFDDRNPLILVQRILADVPRPPREVDPEISRFYEAAVLRLLAKHPAARFPSAQKVIDTLTEGEESTWWRRRRGGPDGPEGEHATRLIGRDPVRAELRRAYDAARGGAGQVVVVRGEPGSGRTRVVTDLLDSLARDDEEIRVLVGHGRRTGTPRTQPLADAVRDLIQADRAVLPLERYAPEHAEKAADLEAFLREGLRDAPVPPELLDVVPELLGRLVAELAQRTPVILFVDDVDVAPPTTRRALTSIARATRDLPALLVVTAAERLSPEWIAELGRDCELAEQVLGRLSVAQVERLLDAATFGEALSTQLRDRIQRAAGGNPLFALEILEANWTSMEPDSGTGLRDMDSALEIPASVRAIVRRRFDGLDPLDHELLEAAAVAGEDIDPGLVAQAVGMSVEEAHERLVRLARERKLVRPETDRLAFDHLLVRETLREGLPSARRRQLNSVLGEAIERRAAALGSAVEGEAAVEICGFFLAAEKPGRAARYALSAVETLLRTNRVGRALELIDGALGGGGAPPELELELILHKLACLSERGAIAEGRAVIAEARRLARELGDQGANARVQLRQGIHMMRAGAHRDAEAALRIAVQLARNAGLRAVEASALHRLGLANIYTGRLDRAIQRLQQSLQLLTALKDRHGQARVHADLAAAHDEDGSPEEARQQLEACGQILQTAPNLAIDVHATSTQGHIHLRHGRLALANESFDRSLALARELGSRRLESRETGNLGLLNFLHGDLDHAEERLGRALRLARGAGDRHLQALHTLVIGRLSKFRGRYRRALDALLRALDLGRELGLPTIQRRVLLHLAHLYALLGDLLRADRMLGAAATVTGASSTPMQDPVYLATRALLAEHVGDLEKAASFRRKAIRAWQAQENLPGEVAVRVQLSRTYAETGRTDVARRGLAAAEHLARRVDSARDLVLCTVYTAALPKGDVRKARTVLDLYRPLLAPPAEMEACYRLWTVTEDHELLERAYQLMGELRSHAPPAYRERMVRNVPLHRLVSDAWEHR